MQRLISLTIAVVLGTTTWAHAAIVTDFENFSLAADSFDNDAGPSGAFDIDGHGFNNVYDSTFDVFSGWAISSMTDSTTPGFLNQYSAIAGSGAGGSANYAVGFTFGFPVDSATHPDFSFIDLAAGAVPESVDLTNTTYAYFSMKDGDQFAKKFAAGDFFLLDVKGFDQAGGVGNVVGEVEFYLANFLNGNSDIVDSWETLDLSALSGAKSLRFGVTSSDNGTFGINTPAYFALDNLRIRSTDPVPEPGSLVILATVVSGLSCRHWRKRRRSTRMAG